MMVGEVQTDGTSQTAFIKIYQDAGVIGVAMITLLALCVLLGIFSFRLLKMYVALTESRDKLDTTRTLAVERVSASVLSLSSTVQIATTEIRAEHTEHTSKLSEVASQIANLSGKADANDVQLRHITDSMERTARDLEITRRLAEARRLAEGK